MRELDTYFLLFMLYSFTGWIWESVFCSLWYEHRLVNRGFLNGPYCPIYGSGCIAAVLLFRNIDNIFILFILGGIVCCAIEYATGYMMEKIFHARWWDYYDMRFNINGRICLAGFILFGAGCVFLIKIAEPFFEGVFAVFPYTVIKILYVTLHVIFITDIAVTVTGLIGFNEKLKAFAELMDGKIEAISEKIQKSPSGGRMLRRYRAFTEGLTKQQKRIIKAFPQLRFEKYDRIIKTVKKLIKEKKYPGDDTSGGETEDKEG